MLAIAGLVPLGACGDDDGDVTDDDPMEDMGTVDEDMGTTPDEDMGTTPDEDMGTTPDEDMGTPEMGDFTFNLTRFMPHNGQNESYSLRDAAGAEGASGTDRVTGGNLSIPEAGVIVAGATYTISFYADIDDSGTCDAPPTDHVWQLTDQTADAMGDLTAAYEHGTDFTPAACDDF